MPGPGEEKGESPTNGVDDDVGIRNGNFCALITNHSAERNTMVFGSGA